jgi:RNA polymerase sigma factor (sigma-70 family)
MFRRKSTHDPTVILGKLYDAYVDKLYAYGIQLCADHDYVKDCIHDIFLNFYKHNTSWQTLQSPEAYLFASLRHAIGKRYKSKIIAMEDINLLPEILNAATDSVEEEIIQDEFIEHAFNHLTEKQRECVHLRFTLGKSYDEIAMHMNVSVETSRTMIYRCLKILRKHMAALLCCTATMLS